MPLFSDRSIKKFAKILKGAMFRVKDAFMFIRIIAGSAASERSKNSIKQKEEGLEESKKESDRYYDSNGRLVAISYKNETSVIKYINGKEGVCWLKDFFKENDMKRACKMFSIMGQLIDSSNKKKVEVENKEESTNSSDFAPRMIYFSNEIEEFMSQFNEHMKKNSEKNLKALFSKVKNFSKKKHVEEEEDISEEFPHFKRTDSIVGRFFF